MKSITNNLFLILFIFLIMRCGSGNEFISVSMQCRESANKGNAVVVFIYQLTNSDKFRFSSFESLIKNPNETLGSDLVFNSIFEKTLIPGDTLSLDNYEIKNETQFLGIVANFYAPSRDGWQLLIPVNEDLEQLIITIHENRISADIIE